MSRNQLDSPVLDFNFIITRRPTLIRFVHVSLGNTATLVRRIEGGRINDMPPILEYPLD